MVFKKHLNFFIGNCSQKFILSRIIPIINILFYGLLMFSSLFFPQDFNIIKNNISNLGNPILNQFPGTLLFTFAFLVISIALPFVYIYIYRRLVKFFKYTAIPGLIFFFMASVGLFMLSLFPNVGNFVNIHLFSGIFSFACFVTGLIFFWVVILKNIIVKKSWHWPISISAISIFIGSLLFIVIELGLIQSGIHSSNPWFLGFSFLEWILLFNITIQTGIFILIIPKNIPT
ncbi:MAG: hypothetical protein GF329_05785 [Candidatus Lokiarchaeota archaeon]|nr:hypothetical protein [Candidatus Lokiarchaeota archaeon]